MSDAPRKRGRPKQDRCLRGHDLTDPANRKPCGNGTRCRKCQQIALQEFRRKTKERLQQGQDHVS